MRGRQFKQVEETSCSSLLPTLPIQDSRWPNTGIFLFGMLSARSRVFNSFTHTLQRSMASGGGDGFTTSVEDQANAAALKAGASEGGAGASLLDAHPSVIIDEGTHKYVLIEARAGGDTKILVRMTADAPYHADVAKPYVNALRAAGADVDVPGGGRISHDPVAKTVSIFGFSYGFGKADHAISADVCRTYFGEDYTVTWSDEGY